MCLRNTVLSSSCRAWGGIIKYQSIHYRAQSHRRWNLYLLIFLILLIYDFVTVREHNCLARIGNTYKDCLLRNNKYRRCCKTDSYDSGMLPTIFQRPIHVLPTHHRYNYTHLSKLAGIIRAGWWVASRQYSFPRYKTENSILPSRRFVLDLNSTKNKSQACEPIAE